MAKLLIPFAVLLAVIGATVVSDPPRPRADFTFVNRGDVKTLDLQRMSWMQDLRVGRLLFPDQDVTIRAIERDDDTATVTFERI